jgi:acetoin utilization protein AcuB
MSRVELKRVFLRGLFAGVGHNGMVPNVTVGAVMTPRPFTVSTDCSARQLVEFFHKKQFRHFLVTDNGRLAGIISDRDVIPYFGENSPLESEEFTKVTAADLMSTDLIVVQPTTPLAAAIEQMVDSGINSLPVVDGVETVGILTSTDIFLSLEQLLFSAAPAYAAAD